MWENGFLALVPERPGNEERVLFEELTERRFLFGDDRKEIMSRGEIGGLCGVYGFVLVIVMPVLEGAEVLL